MSGYFLFNYQMTRDDLIFQKKTKYAPKCCQHFYSIYARRLISVPSQFYHHYKLFIFLRTNCKFHLFTYQPANRKCPLLADAAAHFRLNGQSTTTHQQKQKETKPDSFSVHYVTYHAHAYPITTITKKQQTKQQQ